MKENMFEENSKIKNFDGVDGKLYDKELSVIEYTDNYGNTEFYSVEHQTDGKGYSVLKQITWDNPDPEAEYPKATVLEKDIVYLDEAIKKLKTYFEEH